MNLGLDNRDVVKQRHPGLGLVACGIGAGEPALITPPEADATPVDAAHCRRVIDGGEHGNAHGPAGEHNANLIARIEQIDGLGDESRSH